MSILIKKAQSGFKSGLTKEQAANYEKAFQAYYIANGYVYDDGRTAIYSHNKNKRAFEDRLRKEFDAAVSPEDFITPETSAVPVTSEIVQTQTPDSGPKINGNGTVSVMEPDTYDYSGKAFTPRSAATSIYKGLNKGTEKKNFIWGSYGIGKAPGLPTQDEINRSEGAMRYIRTKDLLNMPDERIPQQLRHLLLKDEVGVYRKGGILSYSYKKDKDKDKGKNKGRGVADKASIKKKSTLTSRRVAHESTSN